MMVSMSQALAVPAHTALLRDFVNTRDVETGEEELSSAAALTRWLRERALIEPHAGKATSAQHEHALELRESLRAAMVGHHDNENHNQNHNENHNDSRTALDAACAEHPVRVSLSTGSPALEPVTAGVAGGLARIVAAIVESGADGTWPRLKVCPEDTCQWAFVDTSKNRSRTWCAMRVCGNRSKTRSYRARQRSSADAG